MADSAAHVVLAAFTALSWLGLGALVLAPAGRSGDRALDLLNRFGAGAVAFALLTFGAGWLRLLYAPAYIPVAVACAAVGLVAARKILRGTRLDLGTWARWELALFAVLAVFVVIDVVATCAPISSADALFHHAAGPKLFEQKHRLMELPWSWNSYQPYTVEMLILDGFLLWNSIQGAFAPLLLALGGAAGVGFGASRLLGRAGGLLAACAIFAQAFMVWMASSTFVEPAIVLMLALAGWNFVQFVRTDDLRALVLAGLFAGATAGIKYPGAAAVMLFALAGAVVVRRRLTWGRVAAFALPALAVALPWYVKNAIVTSNHNPVYPFVFGGANAQADSVARASLKAYGFGRSPLDLLLLPARLLADAGPFDRGEFFSPLFVLFAPLAFLDRRERPYAAAAWAAGIVYVLAWFVGSQHSRFLVPVMPVFGVLAAAGILALARSGRLGRLVCVAVVTGALAAALGISLVYVRQFVPVAVGTESSTTFLRDKTSYYEGIEWLNRNLPPGAHVAMGHIFVLYLNRPYVVWTADVLPSTAGLEATRAFARRWSLDYAAVLASNEGTRAQQLRYLQARLVARVPVHSVVSRTLNELGPPDTMLVYELPRAAR